MGSGDDGVTVARSWSTATLVNPGSVVLVSVLKTCFESPSATISSKWYESASASVAVEVTRSQRSIVKDVKPEVDR